MHTGYQRAKATKLKMKPTVSKSAYLEIEKYIKSIAFASHNHVLIVDVHPILTFLRGLIDENHTANG